MDFGHPQHVPSPDDLTILHCLKCDWQSGELTCAQVAGRGVPWYCDDCGKAGLHWVRFHPSERGQVLMCLPSRK